MRALRVVGITGDGADGGPVLVVLEDPDRRERFTVPADETLRAAARGDLARLGQISIEVESQLRPREIQARIRAGASVTELALATGVPEPKIERFAYPVLLERSRTAELARMARPIRESGPDSRTLGEVVADTFGLRGQEYDEAVWDSWKGEDGRWIVALAWHAGRSDNTAHWTFQPAAGGGTVTPVDEYASDLVEGLPARPLRTVGPVIDLARGETQSPDAAAAAEPERVEPHQAQARMAEARAVGSREAGSRAGGFREAEARVVAASRAVEVRAAEDRAAEIRAAEDRAVEARVAEDRAVEARVAEDRAVEARVAEIRAADARAAETRAAEARVAEAHAAEARAAEAQSAEVRAAEVRAAGARPAGSGLPYSHGAQHGALTAEPGQPEPTPVEPAAQTPEPAVEAPAEAAPPPTAPRRTKKGKPVMPSWDEVLLGVRGSR